MNDPRTDLQKPDEAPTTLLENTRSGPVYCPTVDIFETENAITLLADMPGVGADDLTIDLRESVLSLTGRIAATEDEKEEVLMREHRSGTFYRQFTLAESIDQAKIDARLSNGVLRLELPKVEKAKPRQISVRTH